MQAKKWKEMTNKHIKKKKNQRPQTLSNQKFHVTGNRIDTQKQGESEIKFYRSHLYVSADSNVYKHSVGQ